MVNSDYKILAKVWAKRLGLVLADIIGHHQKGFVPTRDGRAHVITTQSLMDYYQNNSTTPGAFLFLDFKKAFDCVSHDAMDFTLGDFGFPAKLCDLIKNLYSTSSTRLIDDSLTDTIPISRGTRQGCPLSPLIYAIIAELFNQSIINNEDFTGHTMAKMHKKITAYADDTLGHIANYNDVLIIQNALEQFKKATGLEVQPRKCEVVSTTKFTELWSQEIQDKPNILASYQWHEYVEYLGVPVGTANMHQHSYNKWCEIRDKFFKATAFWSHQSISSVYHRTRIAKSMLLSLLWYHSTIMPLKYDRHSDIIYQIEKEAVAFIWGFGIHKISRSQIMLPKTEGGLNMWDHHTKILALRATMIMKMIRAPCPEIRQLFEAIDLEGKQTLSYLPYIIRRNSTANNPLLLPLFEEICASLKLVQTRNQNIKAGQNIWDSDVDGCPIGDSPGIT